MLKNIAPVKFAQRSFYSIFKTSKTELKPGQVENYTITPLAQCKREQAVRAIKQYCIKNHVLMKSCNGVVVENNCAIDEYLHNLLKQGNTLVATTGTGRIAGMAVNFASCCYNPKYLESFASNRQNEDIKNLFYFIAKLQETPNLWELCREQKIFELKWLYTAPVYRRRGVALALTRKSIELAKDQQYGIFRMDCINSVDYRIAEKCMMHCLYKFPVSQLVNPFGQPFIPKESSDDCLIRVYVDNLKNNHKNWIKCFDALNHSLHE